MKRALLVCGLVLLTCLANAQKIYFIYLQTESGEPFFIRMNDKLYSSTASGYLILPRLINSTYSFKLGFPGKNIDLDFTTTLNKKDHGYLVKDFGDKGWGLFDLQSLSVQMSSSNVRGTSRVSTDPNVHVNAFTDMLAKATDDPSLRENAIFANEVEKKPGVTQTVQTVEKKPEITDAVVKTEKKPDVEKQPGKRADDDNRRLADSNSSKTDVTQHGAGIKTEAGTNAGVDALKQSESKADVIKVPSGDSSREQRVEGVQRENDSTRDMAGMEKKSNEGALTLRGTKSGDTDTNQQKTDPLPSGNESKTEEAYKKSNVTKLSGARTDEGFESVFIDEFQNGNRDTIRILIPAEDKPVINSDSQNDSTKANRKFLDFNSSASQQDDKHQDETKKEEPKKWGLFNKNKNESAADTGSGARKDVLKNLWPFNKNKTAAATGEKGCKAVASNDDFLRLRRKMAGKTNDDGMLAEAGKYFKEKCFTTEQIKNLGSMFLSSAGKYNFFELAHDYVSDKENFSSLQSELTDQFYIDQFKAKLSN